jgi:hypothetical protein
MQSHAALVGYMQQQQSSRLRGSRKFSKENRQMGTMTPLHQKIEVLIVEPV